MSNATFDFEAYYQKMYAGKTWAKVMEENEYFDGEPEITAAAHERWKEVNQTNRVRSGKVSR